jgi:hypothetical protein
MSSKKPVAESVAVFRQHFGDLAYKITGPDNKVITKNWFTNPNHPANRAGGVKPVLQEDWQKYFERKGKK